MPLATPAARNHVATKLALVLCAVALVTGALLISAQATSAQDLSSRIAAVRAAQKSAESAMRAQDRVILKLSAQRQAASKQVKPLEKALKAANAALAQQKAILQERKARLLEKEQLWKGATASPPPGDWSSRLAAIRKEVRIAESRKENMALRARSAERAVKAKRAQIASLKRQRTAAVNRREAAEGALSANIKQMTTLARTKVADQATVALGEGGTYSWPSTGRISQDYGCSRLKFYAPRGSCKHFHDGIDVVDAYGTPIRSVAAGVVAYSGWNPYDKEGRAYVVDVVHADGFVSRYGHLIPTDHVKAGELVHTGQVVGKMGNTGFSTGTHLHFELHRGGKDVDPMDYLPAGVVQVDKTSTKAGQNALDRDAREAAREAQKRKERAEREWQPPAKAFAYSEQRKVATCDPPETQDKKSGGKKDKKSGGKKDKDVATAVPVECEPTGLFAAATGEPSIPKPYRGAAPAPG